MPVACLLQGIFPTCKSRPTSLAEFSLPEKWKFSLFPFSIHIVTELEQGAKNTALLRAGTLSRVRVRKPAAQGASGSTETLLTTAHASKLGQSWGKKMPGISLHFWALDIPGSESSDAWGKHLDLRKQNQHCEDAEVEAPKGLLHSRSERNVTALSSQDLSRRNFLQCPEVRIPANIKMPLLSGCTSPACSSPHALTAGEVHLAAAPEIILPGAVWATEICQQPGPFVSP